MIFVNASIASKNKSFSMRGSTSDIDGDNWDVIFKCNPSKRGYRVSVTAKCTTKRAPIIDARNNCSKILDLWPIEFWPEFAKPLAYSSANGNDGSIQEGLF